MSKKKKAAARPAVLAKLHAPRLASTIPRARLFRRLNTDLRRGRIVWVTAPAGSGKTTLAAGYAGARNLKHLWFQFDPRDADPATFFYYLREAAAQISPRARRVLPLLTPEYAFGLNTYTRNFFEQLGVLLKTPCLLVFDNYHELPDDAPVHALLADGLKALPESISVLVLSRNDSPPAFAGLHAGRGLGTFNAALLALTLPETRALARRYRFVRLTPEVIANLCERTRGWTAGAILMLEEAAQGRVVAPRFDRPMTHAMFNYFAAEVLQRAPAVHQKVLLVTALLPQVSAEIARSLTGEDQAGHVLAELARKGYFVTALEGRGSVYQYHPLFREFLLARLQEEYAPEELTALRRRAAAHAESSGNVEDAVQLWIDAGAPEELSQYLYRAAPILLGQGRSLLLAAWIGAVPATRRVQDPWLSFWLGQCRLPFAPSEARVHFENALDRFEARGERAGALLAWTGLVDVSVHEGHNLAALDHWINVFPRLAGSKALPREIEDDVVVRMFSALVLRQLQHPDLALWRERTYAILQSSADANLRVLAGVYLCIFFSWSGDVGRARQSLNWLTSLTRTPGIGFPPLLLLLVSATEALHAWLMEADTRQSLEIVENTRVYGEQVGIRIWEHHLFGHGAAAALAAGDSVAAQKMLLRLADGLGQARLLDVGYYHFLANWDALQRGDLAEAEAHRSAAEALTESIGLAFGNALVASMNARMHIEQGQYATARPWLDEGHRLATANQSHLIEYAIAMDEADLALRTGDEPALRHWLERAFAVGRVHGLTNFHGWQPVRMAVLCARALALEIEVEYVQILIRRRALAPPPSAEAPDAWPWKLRVHTFGRFALFRDGKPVKFEGRTQKRALDLLKALIAFGGREVSEPKLCDALWPAAEADDARANLKMTLHRLRGLLGQEAVVLRESKLSLDTRACWVDVWSFERLLNRLIANAVLPTVELERIGQQLFALYRGPFLGEEESGFALPARERLRGKWMRTIALLADRFQVDGAHERALAWYERGLGVEPLAEPFYQGIMRTCLATRRAAEGLAAYERLRKILALQLQVSPAPDSEALARALRMCTH